jgi:PAS domain S-box-containing protein
MNEHDMNRYLKEIINTMNDGVVLVSPDGSIMMVNRAMEEITGYTRQELLGRPCSVFHCDTCATARSIGRGHWCEIFDVGHTHKRSCMLKRRDGSYIHVLKNASLLKDTDGKVLGAVETVTDISEIDRRDQKIEELSRLLDAEDVFHGMVGRSPAMKKVFEIIEKAAQSDAPVIIHGETGTGKELVAHAIHELGSRRKGPYIQLNCAALNEALLESELFGHVKGAFTGAYSHRKGWFEAANGGDIFLDEIGDVPLSIQVKLLRVLETKQFQRVGDHQPVNTDARIITATNRDLEQLVSEGKFREDFYFRINVIPIHLPPLRDRINDAPLLIEHFIRQLRKKSGKHISGLSADAMDLVMSHTWPGNVRELRSVLEYAFVVAEKELIRPEHLPVRMRGATHGERINDQSIPVVATDEKAALIDALIKCRGNQTHAARMLGVNRVTIWHRIKKYGIDIEKLEGP